MDFHSATAGELISGRYLQYFGFSSGGADQKGNNKHAAVVNNHIKFNKKSTAESNVELHVESLVAGPLAFREVTDLRKKQEEVNGATQEQFKCLADDSRTLHDAVGMLEQQLATSQEEQVQRTAALEVDIEQKNTSVVSELEDLRSRQDKIVTQALPMLRETASDELASAVAEIKSMIREVNKEKDEGFEDLKRQVGGGKDSALSAVQAIGQRCADEIALVWEQIGLQKRFQDDLSKELNSLCEADQQMNQHGQSLTGMIHALTDRLESHFEENKSRIEKVKTQLTTRMDSFVDSVHEVDARRENLSRQLTRDVDRLTSEHTALSDSFSQRFAEMSSQMTKEIDHAHGVLSRSIASQGERMDKLIKDAASAASREAADISSSLRATDLRLEDTDAALSASMAAAEARVSSLEEFRGVVESAEAPAYVLEEDVERMLDALRTLCEDQLHMALRKVDARWDLTEQRTRKLSSEIALVQERALSDVAQTKATTGERLERLQEGLDAMSGKFQELNVLSEDCGLYFENMEELMSLLEVRLGWKPGAWPRKRPQWLIRKRESEQAFLMQAATQLVGPSSTAAAPAGAERTLEASAPLPGLPAATPAHPRRPSSARAFEGRQQQRSPSPGPQPKAGVQFGRPRGASRPQSSREGRTTPGLIALRVAASARPVSAAT